MRPAAQDEISLVMKMLAAKEMFRAWRWFIDGVTVVMEPPTGTISKEQMAATVISIRKGEAWTRLHDVRCIYREAPRPGVYLAFTVVTS